MQASARIARTVRGARASRRTVKLCSMLALLARVTLAPAGTSSSRPTAPSRATSTTCGATAPLSSTAARFTRRTPAASGRRATGPAPTVTSSGIAVAPPRRPAGSSTGHPGWMRPVRRPRFAAGNCSRRILLEGRATCGRGRRPRGRWPPPKPCRCVISAARSVAGGRRSADRARSPAGVCPGETTPSGCARRVSARSARPDRDSSLRSGSRSICWKWSRRLLQTLR